VNLRKDHYCVSVSTVLYERWLTLWGESGWSLSFRSTGTGPPVGRPRRVAVASTFGDDGASDHWRRVRVPVGTAPRRRHRTSLHTPSPSPLLERGRWAISASSGRGPGAARAWRGSKNGVASERRASHRWAGLSSPPPVARLVPYCLYYCVSRNKRLVGLGRLVVPRSATTGPPTAGWLKTEMFVHL